MRVRTTTTELCFRAEHLPVRQINICEASWHGGELISPNWHFTSAVSRNCFQSIYDFVFDAQHLPPHLPATGPKPGLEFRSIWSAGLLLANLALRPSRVALRASAVEKSVAS